MLATMNYEGDIMLENKYGFIREGLIYTADYLTALISLGVWK